MTEHTPGPWRVKDFNNRLSVYAKEMDADGELWPFPVAGIHGDTGCETIEANARLIAAAPDLLEALQRLLNWGQRFSGGERAEDVAFARQAVAKALGEKP